MNPTMGRTGAPPLPRPIETHTLDQEPADSADRAPNFITEPRVLNWFPRLRSLRQGCYRLIWHMGGWPGSFWRNVYRGTMRVERDFTNTTASGDLYWSPFVFKLPTNNGFHGPLLHRDRFAGMEETLDSGTEIPIYPRIKYRYYLEVTQILESFTIRDSFQLGFRRWRYDHAARTFSEDGIFTAQMTWGPPPSGFPSGSQYLSGTVRDASGAPAGTLTMGWISPYYRKATLEVDRFNQSEYPSGNGAGVTWKSIFDKVGWDVDVYESDTNLAEPSGESWSNDELHAKMLARRDSASLDHTWRYHLLCVRRLDATSRGIMYDAYGSDSNNVPREGAAISSHWTIPDTPTWGTVRGERFGDADAPYFRTAVHEIGHAMGLYHNTVDNGFMNTTGVIADSPGTFPANVKWEFADDDVKRLRHLPDPWVRPGMIPFGNPYSSVPISPDDQVLEAPEWELTVEPLLDCVPLGAPVRVEVTLRNRGANPVIAPASLSLKSGNVRGKVIDSAGTTRTFWPLLRCIEEHETRSLGPGEGMSYSLTLLRGSQGALFAAPGMHSIEVEVVLDAGGFEVGASATTQVMVEAPVTPSHSQAAMKVLSSPDLLLTLVLGGDHLPQGVTALHTALKDEVLQPHFAWIETKRLARMKGQSKAGFETAYGQLSKDSVCSQSELRRLKELVATASDTAKSTTAFQNAEGLMEELARRFGDGFDFEATPAHEAGNLPMRSKRKTPAKA